jgi:hypothetical protein
VRAKCRPSKRRRSNFNNIETATEISALDSIEQSSLKGRRTCEARPICIDGKRRAKAKKPEKLPE